jgi:hypothetical protein
MNYKFGLFLRRFEKMRDEEIKDKFKKTKIQYS